ncbi:MAG: glycosyltransferase family 4 protein [Myxococcota bacterium]
MRVLHIGNIANNGYNNAKLLRRIGVEADVLCDHYRHIMGQPEWEDAEISGTVDEYKPDWSSVDLGGFVRPPWFMQTFSGVQTRLREVLLPPLGHLARAPLRNERRIWRTLRYRQARNVGAAPPLTKEEIDRNFILRAFFEDIFSRYDILHANGADPYRAWLFGNGKPFVAFEHGTLRELPFEDSLTGHLVQAGYKRADLVFITNPDVRSAAERLKLRNYRFIPHPVDETKMRPLNTPLRRQLEDQHQADLILFMPSRQNWAIKGNERGIAAFARLLQRHPRALLVLAGWGQELDRTNALIDSLGIRGRIVWVPPLHKLALVHWYNAADVVLDQFVIGTFGGVAPEAMACARPVVLHFQREIHEWCFEEMPPVFAAQTEEEIFESLTQLADDPALRAEAGARGRRWIEAHHGWRLVAERLKQGYEEVLAGPSRLRRILS